MALALVVALVVVLCLVLASGAVVFLAPVSALGLVAMGACVSAMAAKGPADAAKTNVKEKNVKVKDERLAALE